MKRVTLIVIDSVGIGEMLDSKDFGDEGSDTLGHIYKEINDFKLKNLESLGLRSIKDTSIFLPNNKAICAYGKMQEVSIGKDTTTGHWEMVGIQLNKPFPTYPNGFPEDIIKAFEDRIKTKILGNIVASGTEIIKMLGEEHEKTGFPIVYTSADSVFQIAAHEDVISVDRLYEMCRIAREILKGEHAVGRVIARPFAGVVGHYERTTRRHDFSLEPISKTILDSLVENGYLVKGVGKIIDIFNGKGITESVHIENNMDGVDKTLDFMKDEFDGLIFTNLVDFDMKYGHRNDVLGYGKALVDFDNRLPEIINAVKDNEILIITADHGCDPTTLSTDHSREYVPLLVYGKTLKNNVDLGIRKSFSDIGATILEYFDVKPLKNGNSFLKEIV